MDSPIQTGKIAIELHTKVTIYVSQLSLFMRSKLQKRAEILYPLPDPTQYEIKIDSVQTFGKPEGESTVIPAAENPDYQAAVRAVKANQDQWLNNAVLSYAITCPQRDSYLEIYRDELAKARAEIEDLPEDDFAAIVKCFLASNEDLFYIYRAISQALPMTEEEVNDSYAYFRFRVPRPVISRPHEKPESSVSTGPKPDKKQRLTG